MTYYQKANPNATNSEMDSKIIIKHTSKSKYEQFQEWLNECPVEVIDYQDLSDQFQITFDVPLEDDDDGIEVEQCIIDPTGDYAECVDHLVETMENG